MSPEEEPLGIADAKVFPVIRTTVSKFGIKIRLCLIALLLCSVNVCRMP